MTARKTRFRPTEAGRETCPECGRDGILRTRRGRFRAHDTRPGNGEPCRATNNSLYEKDSGVVAHVRKAHPKRRDCKAREQQHP